MQRFAGVFFQVGTGDADSFASLRRVDKELSAGNDWNLVLADLVTLGQVRVEVVLARKDRAGVDPGIDRETKLYRQQCCLPIHHRQHSRQGDIHRTCLGIRCGAVGGRSPGKYLAVRL